VKLSGPLPVKAKISDVTAARALDTTYQNTRGRPLLCIVTVYLERANVASASVRAEARVASTSPPVLVSGWAGLELMDNALERIDAMLVFAVPNNYYYGVVPAASGAGSYAALSHWVEVEL